MLATQSLGSNHGRSSSGDLVFEADQARSRGLAARLGVGTAIVEETVREVQEQGEEWSLPGALGESVAHYGHSHGGALCDAESATRPGQHSSQNIAGVSVCLAAYSFNNAFRRQTNGRLASRRVLLGRLCVLVCGLFGDALHAQAAADVQGIYVRGSRQESQPEDSGLGGFSEV